MNRADRMDRMPGHRLTATGEAGFSATLLLCVDPDMLKVQNSTQHEANAVIISQVRRPVTTSSPQAREGGSSYGGS